MSMCGLVDKGAFSAVDKQEREAVVLRSHHEYSLASPHDSLAGLVLIALTDLLDSYYQNRFDTSMTFPVPQWPFPL